MSRRFHILGIVIKLLLQYTFIEIMMLIDRGFQGIARGKIQWILGIIGTLIIALRFPTIMLMIISLALVVLVVFNIWIIISMDREELGIFPRVKKNKRKMKANGKRNLTRSTKRFSGDTYFKVARRERRKIKKNDLKEMKKKEREKQIESNQPNLFKIEKHIERKDYFNGLTKERAKEKYEELMASFHSGNKPGDFDQMQEIVTTYYGYCRRKGWM